MKTTKFSIPVSMTAALVGVITCAVSCAKKNQDAQKPLPAPPEPLPTNSVASNSMVLAASKAPAVTNVAAAPTEITNPPPAETTVKAPETITATDTNLPGHHEIVEMPTTLPAAPTNFYAADITTNIAARLSPVSSAGNPNYFFRLRAGYQHIYHGDNNDSYFASLKFYAYGDDLRDQAGKNGWLIPDASAEISSGDIAKRDQDRHPGSDSGLQFRANFTWPWIHWTTLMFARDNSVCPFCKPLALGFGPTVNVGFDHLYNDSSDFRFARYAGVRLSFNRDGFIEYTAGGTDGLDGTRQQVLAEIPFYESRDGEVKYYLRGLWNRGASNRPDILEGGLFLEMSFGTLFTPGKWGDLVPFAQ